MFKTVPPLLLTMKISAKIIKAPEQIPPAAPKPALKPLQVIHRHVPGTGFNALQGSTVQIHNLRQLLLSQLSPQPQSEDVPPDDNMWFYASLHPALYAANHAP